MAVAAVAQDILSKSPFWTEAQCPFSPAFSVSDPKLLVIAGANAAGKSLFFQFLAAWLHKQKILPVTISIRERSGSGTSDVGGMRRAMMFGSEEQQSTGLTSLRVVRTGFRNVADRSAALMLDEPDMGLSEDYARAFGEFLVQEHRTALEANAAYAGLVVVTHSRNLVAGMLAQGVSPSFCAAGMAADLGAWLATPQHHSLDALLALDEDARTVRQTVAQLLRPAR